MRWFQQFFPPAAQPFTQPSSAAFYNRCGNFASMGTAPSDAFTSLLILVIHSNAFASEELYHRQFGGFPMPARLNESIIDEIVASCNGDIRGALQALLLVNEQLEAQLEQLQAAVAQDGAAARGNSLLH
jgi:hypothetical protein